MLSQLMKEEPYDLVKLRQECIDYVQLFEKVALEDPFIDPEQARELSHVCVALIDHLGPNPSEHHRRLVQAAARYFVLDEDGDSDFSVGGLDDDATVANAVARFLGREDLVRDNVGFRVL